MFKSSHAQISFVVVLLLSLLIYLPFASIQWDVNGIIEAQSVEAGGPGMFSPNHMLYRPLGFILYRFLQSQGYEGHSVVVLQRATSAMAALGIAFFFLALYLLISRTVISMIGASFLAISWAYWGFSTDVLYIVPAAMFVSATLALILWKDRPTWFTASAAGVTAALSVLFWEANLFLIPSAMVALWWLHPAKNVRKRVMLTLCFLAVTVSIIALTYLLVAVLVFRLDNLAAILNWAISHGSDVGGRVLMWGHWGVDRLLPLGESAVASFIPVWAGLGLTNLVRGTIQPDKILGQLSLLSLAGIVAYASWYLIRRLSKDKGLAKHIDIVWLLLCYILYLPFILWWEPYSPKWFIVPNIFLVLALVSIWTRENSPKRTLVFSAAVAVIGLSNFTATIWPNHTIRNPELDLAGCFAAHTSSADAFIPTDWNWFEYATYFFDYQGGEIDLRRGGQEVFDEDIRLIQAALIQEHSNGGHLYVTSIDSYSPETLDYFENMVGIPFGVLTRFEQSYASTCGDMRFESITEAK